MPLRYRYKKEHEADIAKEVRGFYVERDSNLILDVEGAVDVETLNGFRDNNRELMRLIGAKTPEEAKTKLEAFKDIDPAEYQRVKDELKTYLDGKAPKLEELVTTRTATMKADFEKKLVDANGEKTTLQKRLEKVLIEDKLTMSAVTKGVFDSSVVDVRNRGRDVFKLEGDEVVAYGVDNKPRYGKTGSPLTIDEWMDELAAQATNLFRPNKGSGSGGGGVSPGHTGPNPYSKKSRNLSMQVKLEKENPTLAKRLEMTAQNE